MVTRIFALCRAHGFAVSLFAVAFTVMLVSTQSAPVSHATPAPVVPIVATPTPTPTPTPLPTPTPDPNANAQQVIQDALAGTSYPITIQLKSMDSTWRVFQAGAADQQLAALGAYMAVLSGGQTPGNQYFTQGNVVLVGETPYLVAYRMPAKSLDVSSLLGPRGDFAGALPGIITPTTSVTLSLLNLKTLGAIDNVQQFDLDTLIETARGERTKLASALGAQTDSTGVVYLTAIAQAVLRSTRARANVLPPMQSMAVLERSIDEYIPDHTYFTDPITHRQFYVNATLSNRPLSDFTEPGTIVVAYSDAPGGDGLRAVAFLDGTARLVDVDEWAGIQTSQQLP